MLLKFDKDSLSFATKPKQKEKEPEEECDQVLSPVPEADLMDYEPDDSGVCSWTNPTGRTWKLSTWYIVWLITYKSGLLARDPDLTPYSLQIVDNYKKCGIQLDNYQKLEYKVRYLVNPYLILMWRSIDIWCSIADPFISESCIYYRNGLWYQIVFR